MIHTRKLGYYFVMLSNICLPLLVSYQTLQFARVKINDVLSQGCTISGCRVVVETKLCTMATNICGVSVRNLLHFTPPVPRILKWLLDICENLVTTLLRYSVLPFCERRIHLKTKEDLTI